jgi:prepilin-type N-terminal cleavage/methylation domain-containing protein
LGNGLFLSHQLIPPYSPMQQRPPISEARQVGRRHESAYSLVEMLVVTAIIAILVLMTIQGFARYKKHAAKVQCISKMRTVHAGLAGFYVDKNHWPQPTISIEHITEENYFEWWISVIEPYGVSAEDWLCPVDAVKPEEERIGSRASYIPTRFDSHRYTPVRWNQPWLTERGDMHGKGPHIAMPDGSISTELQFGGN